MYHLLFSRTMLDSVNDFCIDVMCNTSFVYLYVDLGHLILAYKFKIKNKRRYILFMVRSDVYIR